MVTKNVSTRCEERNSSKKGRSKFHLSIILPIALKSPMKMI